jgi:hypothetical protein
LSQNLTEAIAVAAAPLTLRASDPIGSFAAMRFKIAFR